MKKYSGAVLIAAAAILTACQTPGSDKERAIIPAAAASEVVFTPLVLDKEGYCLVGFGVTYPENADPHRRQIRVTELWSGDIQDYPLPIPPQGAPDNFIPNGDGTVTFTGMATNSIMGCDRELAARTLAIGPCAEGICLPARFVEGGSGVELALAEAEY